jgi:bacterioferritin (cytochrome b1)
MCEDLVDERVAIDTSGQIIRYFGIDDSMTRRTLEETLANPEEYADYLAGTLNGAVS